MEKIIIHASGILLYILLLPGCSPSGTEKVPAYEEEAPTGSDTSVRAGPAPEPGQYEARDGLIFLSWKNLADVVFEWKYHEEMGRKILLPVFSPSLRAIEGREVQISGYVIPLEEAGVEEYTVLSAFPYTQCFFCGGAGPESVMDILPKEPPGRLRMDQKVSFRGRLRLNGQDLMYLNYILEDAVLVE